MKRRLFESRVILTGASDGIGRALALELAKESCRLVLVARREAQLQETAAEVGRLGGHAEIVAGDLCDEAVRQMVVDRARTAFHGIDLLVNNAGVGDWARFEHQDPAQLRRLMEINFFAPIELLRLALPTLREGHHPMVVNIGSVLGYTATPRNSGYCASKFALRGFGDSIRPELRLLGVELLLVSPGSTSTEFHSHVLTNQADLSYKPRGVVTPQEVARQTVAAIANGKTEIIPNRAGRWLVRLGRFAPALLQRLMSQYG